MAKRKLSQDQKRRLKKRKKRRSLHQVASRSRTKMLGRLKDTGLEQYQVAQTPVGDTKMSEVMWEFLEPYLEDAPTLEMLHKLVSVALVAWNVAILPATESPEEYLNESMQVIPPNLRADFKAIVQEMVERKQKYFAQYTRPILDYELVDTGEGYHLSVVSLVDPKEIEE